MNKTKEEQLIEFIENNKDKSAEVIASTLGLSISYIRSLIWRIKNGNNTSNRNKETKAN